MSSRDRMDRRDSRSPEDWGFARESGPDDDQDFWDMDPADEGDDDLSWGESAQETRRTRTVYRPDSASTSGTAGQIDRLRRSLSRSGQRDDTQRGQETPRRSRVRTTGQRPTFDDDRPSQDDDVEPVSPRRQRIASPPRGVRQRQAADTWLVEEDDDRYYDDDEDFDEYDAPPRRTPLTQAPPIRMTRPNVRRPSLPPAISQADLVNDALALAMIGIGLLSLAAMAIFVANQVDSLAPSFATHVSASGVLEDFRGSDALWRLPLLATMLTLMNVGAAWFISPIDRFASRFLIATAIVVQLVTWVALIRLL